MGDLKKHTHIEVESRDCDGGHGRSSVVDMSLERAFGLWSLPYTKEAPAAFQRGSSIDARTGMYLERLSWYVPTEEGHCSEEWRECVDDGCVDKPGTVYDEFAQKAGY